MPEFMVQHTPGGSELMQSLMPCPSVVKQASLVLTCGNVVISTIVVTMGSVVWTTKVVSGASVVPTGGRVVGSAGVVGVVVCTSSAGYDPP